MTAPPNRADAAPAWQDAPAAEIPWQSLAVLVCGAGRSGTAAAEVLLRAGAHVQVVDAGDVDPQRVAALRALGASVSVGEGARRHPHHADLVVTSPGWRPDHPLLTAAARAGIPVWGEVELAARFTRAETRWLAVTGTNGKTTTTEMLAAMLQTAGLRSAAAGNIGAPAVAAVTSDPPPEWLAVELSSFQLHWSPSIRPRASVVINVAPDHLDWHGGLAAYAAAKARVFSTLDADGVAVVNVDDAAAVALADAVPSGTRTVAVTLGEPRAGQLGVEGGALVDRAFATAERICAVDELGAPAPHNLTNALCAAALARVADVPTSAIARALRDYRTGAHRLALVATIDDVRYVDDSKATNPHAAGRALAAFDHVVWIAGGLNKDLRFDDLIADSRDRLRAAVLIGQCRDELRDALTRGAPDVPVVYADSLHTAVVSAQSLAVRGDTVLLAPAAASMDMFRDYAERGDSFARAVSSLAAEHQMRARS
ncbi:MAG: UDP-N-acetylmuramoyl-L-alanine--D-glutamate ligase [Frankia sp.]|nr:UDP-N-acetylmuramoyl-L-alanine--D-glutamate ligase [Frankia sp.]